MSVLADEQFRPGSAEVKRRYAIFIVSSELIPTLAKFLVHATSRRPPFCGGRVGDGVWEMEGMSVSMKRSMNVGYNLLIFWLVPDFGERKSVTLLPITNQQFLVFIYE